MNKLPVGVLGGSGYAGRELCALVLRHPGLELRFATANERRGERARIAGSDVTFVAPDEAPLADAALVFSALPHGASAAWVARAVAAGCRVVDLSSDFRPGHGGGDAPIPDLDAPYGLPELLRDRIAGARVVANPGCYPTAILLALAPLLRRGLVDPAAIIVADAASGVTGAGFTARPDLLFGEVTENFRAYGVGNVHRHLPEMRAVVAQLGGERDLLFTPHLLPVARGILATLTVPLTTLPADPLAPFREDYAEEPFVEIAAEPPALREVVGRNVARIHAVVARGLRQPAVQVFSAIDNLLKGAAGQAVQNANLMLGLPETMGLPA